MSSVYFVFYVSKRCAPICFPVLLHSEDSRIYFHLSCQGPMCKSSIFSMATVILRRFTILFPTVIHINVKYPSGRCIT